jgi:hypothetical protein
MIVHVDGHKSNIGTMRLFIYVECPSRIAIDTNINLQVEKGNQRVH